MIRGRTWKFGDGIDTDVLYPGHALSKSIPEAAEHVLESIRPGWVDDVGDGDVIVAGNDFGIGSSRPVALLLKHLGIVALIADSFSSLFQRNCINYGLPAVTAPSVTEIFEEGDVAELSLETGMITNARTGVEIQGERYPEIVLSILNSGGLIPRLESEGFLETSEEKTTA